MTHVPLTVTLDMWCSDVQMKDLCKQAGGHAGTDESSGDAKIDFLDDVLDMH